MLALLAASAAAWVGPSTGVASASAAVRRAPSVERTTALAGLFRRAPTPATVADEAYDYIIVGGGTAGCVLANRLSADGDARVLVLEAGSEKAHKSMIVKIPVGLLKLLKSEHDWFYQTAPSPSISGREVYLCRGKMLGGSSCTNVMLYNRGAAGDYDRWAAECGDDTWNAAGMLPFFKRAEDCRSTENSGVGEWHGKGGPYTTSDVPYQNPMSKAFLQAAAEAGEPANYDFNDWSRPQAGFGRFQVSQRGGQRVEAAASYLEPVRGRANLRVISGALATSIELDKAAPAGPAATGVAYTDEATGERRVARLSARGEVLLTLGAVGSPQLLMLSGVGPAAHLQDRGVEPVVNVPGVGANLQDHPAVLLSCSAEGKKGAAGVSQSSRLRLGETTRLNPGALAQWLLFGKGPLCSPGCDHGGFAHSDEAAAGTGALPDLQFRFLASKSTSADGMSTISDEYLKAKGHADGITLQAIGARPRTRGRLRLRSADPADKPLIEGLYLEDEQDVKTLVAGLRKARSLLARPSLEPYQSFEEFPGADATTDAQLAEYVRQSVHSANALVGSCKMGKGDDPMAVVDSELRVRGLSRVRVCDASIMPTLPGGQTASSTIAIAEKAADMLARKDARAPAPVAKVLVAA
ncbi:hypothetical protein KFE25_013680 [Diacronema lutheri]|uniref:Glucose-methanol-choline oxidoreductase N-terminal domain-containing protein n=1 Tax=Diacronema lutheri TaxID=2081491 RepID=A0A8J5XU96_DIALT|nr:hypothetical protein KFE25_013680 [Diacronema lutheri]